MTDKNAAGLFNSAEIQEQIHYLRTVLSQVRAEVSLLSANYAVKSHELQQFLAEYFSHLKRAGFGEVETLPPLPKAEDTLANVSPAILQAYHKSREIEEVILNKEVRKHYRNLVKALHPDVAEKEESALFHSLSEAHQAKDLEQLMLLEEHVLKKKGNTETPVQCLERLERQYQAALEKKDHLLLSEHRMVNSKAWQLMVRSKIAQSQGIDVYGFINDSITKARQFSAVQ
jgi:hypothetical protein